MRWRILAGVQTGTAVMAQVGQIVDISLAERQPVGHGGKDGTKALTVAAGVADLHHPLDLLLVVGQGLRLAD
ncbi:hypothetical protein D3C80_1883710 [compost metagenome]